VGTRVLFFNKELFRRAGLDPESPPVTWVQLRETSRRIHSVARGVSGFGLNAGERYVLFKKFMPFGWGNGGHILTEDLKHSKFFSKENLEALSFYCSLKDCSLVEAQDMLDLAFKQGNLGMMISGGWNLKNIPRDAPDLDFGVALVPKPDVNRGSHASFAGGEILVVFAKSKRKAEALKLARFLVSRENAMSICREAKHVQPAFAGAESDPYYDTNPLERVLVLQLKTAVAPPPHPKWGEIEDAIGSLVEEALHGRRSPEEALREADRRIEAIVSGAGD
ncbi:MAG: extracellular solute-binding protein, partial [Candidatus Eisenbacteria bacterium]